MLLPRCGLELRSLHGIIRGRWSRRYAPPCTTIHDRASPDHGREGGLRGTLEDAMEVLVTGANGHIGYNLTRELLARGHAVRASVRSLADETKTAPLRALGNVELFEVDLYNPKHLRDALDGIEVLFHLAAVYAHVVDRNREQEEIVRPSEANLTFDSRSRQTLYQMSNSKLH
jgi:hypothetical protein